MKSKQEILYPQFLVPDTNMRIKKENFLLEETF